jgi:hypothetical protein
MPLVSWNVHRLDDDGGAVTKNLSGAHHRARVVSNSHHGIGTQFPRMRHHQLK